MTVNTLAAVARATGLRDDVIIKTPASAAATTDLAEILAFKDTRVGGNKANQEGAVIVDSITFIPEVGSTAITPSGTNTWAPTVTRYAAGGTGATVVKATPTTAGTGLAAQVEFVVAAAGLNFKLSAGDQLTLKAVHAATPNAVFPAGMWVIGLIQPA